MKDWDRRALEGLPLKLLMMSLLISLSAPAVLGSLDDFERSTARSRLEAEASRLWRTVEEVAAAGEGNRRTIVLDLSDSLSSYGMSMEIGGSLDESASRGIRCCCEGAVFGNLILSDPPAKVTSVDNSMMELGGGVHRLVLECQRSGGQLIVMVSVSE